MVPNMSTCFELLGFDILIDANGKPWLIEVNSSPALSIDCRLDEIVKSKLVKDTVNLVGDNFNKVLEQTKSTKPRPFINKKNLTKKAAPLKLEQIDQPT